MSAPAWPDAIARSAAVTRRLAGAFVHLRARNITAGELDSILEECRDTMAAIERDTRIAWAMGCQTRAAVKQGRAEWAA